jgi:hypothetical protein
MGCTSRMYRSRNGTYADRRPGGRGIADAPQIPGSTAVAGQRVSAWFQLVDGWQRLQSV